MSVFNGVGPAAVAEDLLCDVDAGNLVQVGGSRMAK